MYFFKHILRRVINVTASPNPFTDHVAVTIESNANKTVQLRLFNGDGKLIWRKNLQVAAGTNIQYLNGFQSLPSGIYYIKVDRTNSSADIKLLKQQIYKYTSSQQYTTLAFQ